MQRTNPTDEFPIDFDRAAVAAAWQAFIQGEAFNRGGVRDIVVDSWERCRAHGIDARTQGAPHVGDGEPLETLLENHLELLHAAALTWRVLAESLAASDNVVVIADPTGVILEVKGNPELVEAAAAQNVGPGRDWSEAASGTNAIGTALVLDRPTLVRTTEHYCKSAKIWDCAASPIRDLSDGSVLGVLDVTNLGDLTDRHTLSLAVTAAHQIEHTLHSQELARSVQLLHWYRGSIPDRPGRAVLLLDRKGRVITANDAAQAIAGGVSGAIEIRDGAPVTTANDPFSIIECLPYRLPADLSDATGTSGWLGGAVVVAPGARSATPVQTAAPAPALAPAIDPAFARIVTADPGLLEIMRRAARMARANSPILLTGETGSGKELFAHAIHACSNVAAGPFVAVNCGTLVKELAASELFGHEAGAFTGASPKGRRGKFEEADKGTLFLDEIGELPLEVQVDLLRVLQDNVVMRVGGNREHRVEVRVVAATHRDLASDTESGRFRADLYYRLKVFSLALPPLRERRGDIDLLVEQFLRRMQGTYGLGNKRASPGLLQWLRDYPWPGNVRELHGLLESMYIMSDRPVLNLTELPEEFAHAATRNGREPGPGPQSPHLGDIEREVIVDEISRNPHNMSQVARRLGISRSTLYRKIRRYGITRE